MVSRDGFGSPVPRQPAHLHTQAESGAYLLGSSRFPRRRPFIYLKPPYAKGSVPSLSGHAIACRWRSLPRVRRHMASKPQGGSERVLPWRRSPWTNPYAPSSPSHTHYWYEAGMLKVPAMVNQGEQVEYYGIASTGFSKYNTVQIKTYSITSISNPAHFDHDEAAMQFVSC